MDKIKFISDSTCDLSKELIDELDLEVIPLLVSFDGDDITYFDGVNLKPEDLVEKVKSTGALPTTAATSPLVFADTFNKYLNKGYKIFYCGIGSTLSSCFHSAELGREDTIRKEDVYLVDSKNLSSSIGLVLLKARDYLKSGMSLEETKNKLDTEVVPFIKTQFSIDTLDYMVKGGRCSSLTQTFTKLFSIKPILVVKEGKLVVGKRPIGTILNALRVISFDMLKDLKQLDLDYVMITAFLNQTACEQIKKEIEKKFKFKNIYVTAAGSVIGSHCGAGTAGILYLTKPKVKK